MSDILRYLSKVLNLILPMIKEKKTGAQCQIGFWILEVMDSSFGYTRPSHLLSGSKSLLGLHGASFEKEKGVSNSSKPPCKLLYHWGPYYPADPMILEVSVEGGDTIWNLWEAPINRS